MTGALLMAVLVAQPAPALVPPPDSVAGECWVAPLRLTLRDVAQTGLLMQELVKNHCLARSSATGWPVPGASYTIGHTRLLKWRMMGEEFGFGIGVSMQGDGMGRDFVYAAPALDLPDSWEQAIEQVVDPVVVVGGAAIFTAVIVQLLTR